MARINDLLKQLDGLDPSLAKEIKTEVKALSDRREFGLNFERHTPEQVELPGRPVRRGDKVHILPPRGETVKAQNKVMWLVTAIDKTSVPSVASLSRLRGQDETKDVPVEDLVVVAEFRDPIYPGLVSTAKVERGGDKPFHAVINSENFHALEALMFTHRGKVDCIYIDPPYNTGAKDWKYNNDYVESDDLYRHSKWLAFMERRLLLAKKLLNPEDSVLIVTIDEKEYLRLGLLLEQIFPEARIQMVSSVIKPGGVARGTGFARSDEYIFFVTFGAAAPYALPLDLEWTGAKHGKTTRGKVHWNQLYRRGADGVRSYSPGCYYPIYVQNTPEGVRIVKVGAAEPIGAQRAEVELEQGIVAVYPPKRPNGEDGRWSTTPGNLEILLSKGFVKAGGFKGDKTPIYFLSKAEREKAESGEYLLTGLDAVGVAVLDDSGSTAAFVPTTQWNISSHDASRHGSNLLSTLLPGRHFPYPKSLYAVEDALRFFVSTKPSATILDFFAGSGTTCHAVMRLNREDGGARKSISITNNEVSDKEELALRSRNLRPGDHGWESIGICDSITKPRILAAMQGVAHDGNPLTGDYKFNGLFPLSDGLLENVEFFKLTYENPLEIESGMAFERVAPLLWLRAGARGERIDALEKGWAITQTYGVLVDMDKVVEFLEGLGEGDGINCVFINTGEDRLFETVSREIPTHIEVIRLYDSYIRNSEIEALGVTR